MSGAAGRFRPEVRRVLPAMVAFRFIINVSVRMTYTFLPAFARGTNVSVETMSRVLSARELTSLSAPLSGRASDRHGTTTVMVWSGIIVIAGLSLSVFGTIPFVIGMLVFGVGRTAYQVSMQAWVGDEVAYERRGRATGIIELSWGGATLLGLPVVGLLIDSIGWRAPLLFLVVVGVPVLALISKRSAAVGRHESGPHERLVFNRVVVAALTVNGCLTAAAQFLFLGHGLWLEDTYDLDPAQVGFAVVAVGAVEVCATLGSARLTDVLGKRLSMLGGGALMTVAMVALAITPEPPLWIGLLLLVSAFLGFEYAIVSAIPLIAELAPRSRARMIAVGISISTVTRAIITLIATAIYVGSGFGAVMWVASAFGATAVVLASIVMVEPGHSTAEDQLTS